MSNEREALRLLKEQWNKEYASAGCPCDYCPNESLNNIIRKLEFYLGEANHAHANIRSTD